MKRLWKNWKSALKGGVVGGGGGERVTCMLFHSAVDESVDFVRVAAGEGTAPRSSKEAWASTMKIRAGTDERL